jgi:ATP-dependent Lon protease
MLLKKEYLLLPLRDVVVFPDCMTVITVTKKTNLISVEKAYLNNEKIVCVAQRNSSSDDVKNIDDIFTVGTLCEIHQKISLPDGDTRVFVRGVEKLKVDKLLLKDTGQLSCLTKSIKPIEDGEDKEKVEQIRSIVFNKAEMFVKTRLHVPFDFIPLIRKLDKDIDLIYILTNIMNIDIEAKQSILEDDSKIGQLLKINQYLEIEKSLIDTEREINDKIDKKIQKHQKDFFLKEKLKVIKDELKTSGGISDDFDENDKSVATILKKKANNLLLSDDAKEKVFEEINKLEDTPTFSPEYSTIKNFLQWILDLPWGKKTPLENSLKDAEEVLNRQHYGLDDIKERIVEFIAVLKNTKKLNGPIICLVGAPGVGKTSLAKSIAEAVNRTYVKVSLGGVRDEAEIRGHRRTYVGAMPGKIIQAMKKAKTDNPLILLDEIDKMNSDLRGDPTAALLEVLDPEQNKSFNDHFIELEYDLSNVMFIATANSLHDIPYPLRDRMEIIKLSGYTEDEKLEIAKKYLIPRQLEKHGLEKVNLSEKIIREIIQKYTFESGVRGLERELETVIRKITRKIVEGANAKSVVVNKDNLKDFLGVEKYSFNTNDKIDKVGVSTGLAYTEMGGDLLYLEALKFDGGGKLNITGKLGEVMKESVQAAFSYVRSKASERGVTSKIFNKFDFHVHVPEGATPKDGPSAGVAISAALMSCLLDAKIRSDTAMTGEITLTGKVLPIGGLKEKLLAALRGNIKNVLIPQDNVKDLEKIPEKVKKEMKIAPIKTIEEAFKFLIEGYDNTEKKRRGKKSAA